MSFSDYRGAPWDLRRIIALRDGTMITEDGQQINANGTTILAAGTSGLIVNASITTASLIRLAVLQSGGTPGVLTAIPTATQGFTITSSSNTDTSQVFWEILKY